MSFPVIAPNSFTTFLYGINDLGWMIGNYYDHDRLSKGLLFIPPNQYAIFDIGTP